MATSFVFGALGFCRRRAPWALGLLLCGCPEPTPADGGTGTPDAGTSADAGVDAGTGGDPDGGAVGPELRVYDLQDETSPNHPRADARVELDEVVVTAIDNTTNERGFWVEEPEGGAYSGIFVYKPVPLNLDLDTLGIGDEVTVRGSVREYNGLTEVELAEVEVTGAVEVPAFELDPPLAEDPEPWEGVLVELCGGCAVETFLPGGEVETSCARIDDQLYDYTLPAGVDIECLRGVWTYAFGEYKLLPRSRGDIVCADGPCEPSVDAGTVMDAGSREDAGTDEGGLTDGGLADAGLVEPLDGGAAGDGGLVDAGPAEPTDGGPATPADAGADAGAM